MAVGLENAAFTVGIRGILVKWPFDLKTQLSQLESLEFWSNGRLTRKNRAFTVGILGILVK